MTRGGSRGAVGRGLFAVAIGTIGLLLVLPALGAAQTIESAPIGPRSALPTAVGISNPAVTWNGKPIGDASTQAHAFSITTDQRVLVNFSFVVPPFGPDVTTARIQALYFGAVISTDQVSTSTTAGVGKGLMNWTLGTFTYLLAGVYVLSASLVDSNGSTVWSEHFYIDATAPYHIGSGLTIFLIVLGLVELYSILTVGRSVRRRPKTGGKAPPEPWQQPASTAEPGAAPAATPPAESPPAGGSP